MNLMPTDPSALNLMLHGYCFGVTPLGELMIVLQLSRFVQNYSIKELTISVTFDNFPEELPQYPNVKLPRVP